MTLKFDPFGYGQAMLDMTERLAEKQIEAGNRAAGEAMARTGEAFAQATGKPIGDAVADVIRDTAPTPENALSLMAQAAQANMDIMLRMGEAMNPWASMMKLWTASASSPETKDEGPTLQN